MTGKIIFQETPETSTKPAKMAKNTKAVPKSLSLIHIQMRIRDSIQTDHPSGISPTDMNLQYPILFEKKEETAGPEKKSFWKRLFS